VIEDLSECYRILELDRGASHDDVKRSYRELVKVWHPDRFVGDLNLQKKAEEKLKQINLAYAWICKGEAAGSRRKSPHAETRASQADEQPPPPSQAATAPATNWGRRIVPLAVTIVIIAVIKAVFSTSDRPRRQTTSYASPYNQPSRSYSAPETPAVRPVPKARQHLTLDQIVDLHSEALKRRPDLGMSVQEFSRYMQANQSDYDFSEGIAYAPPPNSQPGTVPPQVASSPLSGQPAAYSKAESPADGKVASSKPTEENRKQVELALSKTRDSVSPAPSSRAKDFFTIGSTKDEVLAVQGTPSQFNDSSFSYGGSTVHFRNNKVASWYDGYPKLKVKLLPASKAEAAEYFTVGSTKDEVLAVQGTPSQFSDSSFTYGAQRCISETGGSRRGMTATPSSK
jgi:hypothetical protein